MKIERTKNATRNIVWGFIEKIIHLLMPFLARTIMIKVLGVEYLGLNSLFTSILQVLSISELGFGTAVVFSMYKPIANDDTELICALLNVYRKIYQLIATVILSIGLMLVPILPKLINGSYPTGINIYVLFLIYLFNTVVSYYLFGYKTALFSAYQRNDLISKRDSLIYFFQNLLQIILLLSFKNYYLYVLIIPLATILTNIFNAILANKKFPNIVCKGTISGEMKRDIKKRITGLLSFKVYGVIFNSVDTLVISSFLGLTPLAIYNNYFYIQQALIGFLTIFTSSITAGIGNKMITNSPDDNYQDFKKVVFANSWLTGFCAVCLFVMYQPFITWWVGEEYTLPSLTMILMVLYFLLPRITAMTMAYREASGLWWEDRIRPLVATVVNLTTNIILVKMIGLNGVILSTLICTIFIQVPWGSWTLFKYYFKRTPMQYFTKILYYLVITIVVAMITNVVCGTLPDQGFYALLIKAVLCMVISNFLFWMFYRKEKEFDYVMEYVTKIMRKAGEKRK